MLLTLLSQQASVPVDPPVDPPVDVVAGDCWGGAWGLSWSNSWGVISVEPPPVNDDQIVYPGACFPFGGGGKIRPHRTKRRRESDHLLLLH